MTNLDSILKSSDITLPSKICLVKAMVIPVVMYGSESWTIKNVEHQKIDQGAHCVGAVGSGVAGGREQAVSSV